MIIGRSADAEFLDVVREMAETHDPGASLDCVRAYHFGPKFLVEVREESAPSHGPRVPHGHPPILRTPRRSAVRARAGRPSARLCAPRGVSERVPQSHLRATPVLCLPRATTTAAARWRL